jgi:hypothetical protein
MNEQLILILLSVAFAVTAIGLFFGGVLSFVRARAFLRGAARTDGVVIENALAKNSDGGATYVPVVEFSAGERGHRITGRTGTNPPSYEIGERVEVCFSPWRPSEAKIHSYLEIYSSVLLFSIFDAAALVTAAVLYYAAGH